jgi:hypothetical protein
MAASVFRARKEAGELSTGWSAAFAQPSPGLPRPRLRQRRAGAHVEPVGIGVEGDR